MTRGTWKLVWLALALLAPAAARAQTESEALPLGPVPQAREPGGPATSPGGGSSIAEIVRTLGALGVVVGLAVGAGIAARKLMGARGGLAGSMGPGGPSPSGVIEILGRYPVGSGQTLVLLRLDNRVLLLHQSSGRRDGAMRTLSEITDSDEVASVLLKTRDDRDAEVQQGFREAMHRLERDFSASEPEFAGPARAVRQTPEGDRVELLGPEVSHDGNGDIVTLRARLRHWIREAKA